jgi:hypothetical protein
MRWFALALVSAGLALYFHLRARGVPAAATEPAAPPERDEFDDYEEPKRRRRPRRRIPPRALSVFWSAAAVVFLALSIFVVVPAGTAGVPVTFGSAGKQVGPGLHVVSPFTSMIRISTRTEQVTMSRVGGTEPAVGVIGRDGASAAANATLIYRVDRADATRIYRDLGANYRDKVIRPTARSCVRDAFTKFDMIDAATTRFDDVGRDISACLRDGLQGRGIRIESFRLRELQLSKNVQDAIDARVAAQQIAPNLSDDYLRYLYIRALEKFANGGGSTIIVPDGQTTTPVIQIPQSRPTTTTPGR